MYRLWVCQGYIKTLKEKQMKIHLCKICGKSSNVGNKCLYEEKEEMASCPTFIKIKVKQPSKKS